MKVGHLAKYLPSPLHLNMGQVAAFSEWKPRFLAPVRMSQKMIAEGSSRLS